MVRVSNADRAKVRAGAHPLTRTRVKNQTTKISRKEDHQHPREGGPVLNIKVGHAALSKAELATSDLDTVKLLTFE